ncbi:MAG: response regulator [Euryarchaeota archaeon]|nr:response regulator [Euryarchaeota archaeon]
MPERQSKAHNASGPASAGPHQSPRVMILDDSPVILASLKDILATSGVTNVKTAKNVKDGVKVFKDFKPDLVFVDLMLGETESGLDFLKQAMGVGSKAKIVISTALPSTADAVVMAVSLGATEYLPKPFRKEDVDHIIEKLKKPKSGQTDMSYG